MELKPGTEVEPKSGTEVELKPGVEQVPPEARSLFAPYDERCDSIRVPALDKHAAIKAPLGGFDAIPRSIHQIWLGPSLGRVDDTLSPAVAEWKRYSSHFGYDHRLWTEADVSDLMPLMAPGNAILIDRFINARNYHAASDILRLEIVRNLGGIYIDCDFLPPSVDGTLIDFSTFLPMRGTAFATEPDARNIKKSAIFVMNGFFMAAPHHGQIEHLVKHMPEQVAIWEAEQHTIDAPYTTGPFYVNKALSGAFVVMPHTFLQDIGMVVAFWPT